MKPALRVIHGGKSWQYQCTERYRSDLARVLVTWVLVMLSLLVLAFLQSGCAQTRQAFETVKLGGQAMKAAEPVIVAAYAAAQDSCLALDESEDRKECVAKVRAQFEPIKEAIRLYHDSYCHLADFVGEQECQP